MEYTVKWGQNDDVFKDAAMLRIKIFVDEQEFREEFDEIDKTAFHMVVYDEDKTPVATGRIYNEESDVWHLGRICVLKEKRKTGLGRLVVTELEKKAATFSAKKVTLGAQLRAAGFYKTLGYSEVGKIYFEEYCEHINMTKDLSIPV